MKPVTSPACADGDPAPRTIRLYQDDPYATAFEAQVVASLEVEGRPAAVLDRTCFYPTSGGQPHDTGTLNGIPVVDVLEDGGAVVHVLAQSLQATRVEGRVDWARRFDHMQQHTGQHVLSQACLRVAGAPTVSFHLGEQVSTIDLAIADLSADSLWDVVAEANRVTSADLPVTVAVYDDAAALPDALRKAPTVEQEIRVVSVGDYDDSACCGTHVRRTGEIGAIQVTRWERSKGQTRLTFLCGGRAVADHWAKTAQLHELTGLLSCGLDDLVPLVSKALEERKAEEKRSMALQERLARVEAQQLATEAETIAGQSVVLRAFDNRSADELRQLANEITSDSALVAVLAAGAPSPIVCVACGPQSGVHAGELVRAVLAPFGGRGGGSPATAQGGGVPPERLGDVLAAARAWLTDRPTGRVRR